MGIFKKVLNKVFGKTIKDKYKNDKKDREEDPWIPGVKEEDEGIIVTPEELGKVLCAFCYNRTTSTVNDKYFLKILGKNKRNTSELLRTYYFYEMITIYCFFVILQVGAFFRDESIENRILDSMHEALYRLMLIKPSGDELKKIREQFAIKYIEYNKVYMEKNWLFRITSRLLNNLMQQETKDIVKVMELTGFLSPFTKSISDLIENKYKIVLDKNS